MTESREARDAPYWADPVSKLKVSDLPMEASAFNVEGRQVVGPLQGFGQMWQKSYRVRLSGANVTPAEVIRIWKQSFSKFWPQGAKFYAPITGLAPGEVAVIDISGPARMRLSTGVTVIYADGESFTFMNPQGHVYAGWITFSSYRDSGTTVAKAQALVRASDPLWEIVNRLFVSRREDEFWQETLIKLAAEFGVRGQVQQDTILVDPRLQWSQTKNVWYNAAARSTLYAPVRLVRGLLRRERPSERELRPTNKSGG